MIIIEGKTIAPSEFFLRVTRTLTGEPRVEEGLKLEPVEGKFYPFEYKGIQLFAHRSVSYRRLWTVSEKQSGLLVTKSYDTKEEAIIKAKEEIDKRPIEQVREFVRSNAKDIIPFTGVAPKAEVPKIKSGDIISDGLIRGRVISEVVLGKNIPAYEIEILSGHEKGQISLIIKRQARIVPKTDRKKYLT